MSSPNLFIASDHAGFELKTHLRKALPQYGWKDLGPDSADSVDYPDFAKRLGEELLKAQGSPEKNAVVFGVLICGSGQGMAMRANRFSHVRAALCWNEEIAKLARQHNDANVLCLPGRFVDAKLAERILVTFLNTPFDGGRHQRRVDKLNC
jgi:ribose 5-phosphate isomerase B